jgi:hypothetical protein
MFAIYWQTIDRDILEFLFPPINTEEYIFIICNFRMSEHNALKITPSAQLYYYTKFLQLLEQFVGKVHPLMDCDIGHLMHSIFLYNYPICKSYVPEKLRNSITRIEYRELERFPCIPMMRINDYNSDKYISEVPLYCHDALKRSYKEYKRLTAIPLDVSLYIHEARKMLYDKPTDEERALQWLRTVPFRSCLYIGLHDFRNPCSPWQRLVAQIVLARVNHI